MSEADAAYQQGYDRGIASTAAALTAATQRAEQAEAELAVERQAREEGDAILRALTMLPIAALHPGELVERVREVLVQREQAEALNAELAAALRAELTADQQEVARTNALDGYEGPAECSCRRCGRIRAALARLDAAGGEKP